MYFVYVKFKAVVFFKYSHSINTTDSEIFIINEKPLIQINFYLKEENNKIILNRTYRGKKFNLFEESAKYTLKEIFKNSGN